MISRLILILLNFHSFHMETFIGTVFDKSSEEVDFLSFEYELSEYSEWNFVKVNSTNVDDENDILNPENPQETDDEQTGGHILVPEECLNVCESKFSKDFNISAMSSLVIEFNLFVLGYNVSNESSILNPIFKIIFKDLESEKEMNVMDISRLGVTDGEWNSRQFAVEVQEERSIKVTFQLSTGGGAGNEIALDDVQISWIPVMASEVRNDHVNVLFTTPSPSTTTSTSTTSRTVTTTTVSTTTQNSENATTVENNKTTTTATTTTTSTTTTPTIITTTTEQVTEAPQTNQTEGSPTNSTTTTTAISETSTSTTSTNTTTTESPSEETNSTTTTESPSEETNSTTTTESPSEETSTTTTTLSPSEETNTTTITVSSSKETTTESPSETMNTTSTTTTITPTTAKETNETVTTPNVETNQTTTTIKPTSTTSSTIASTESTTNSSAVITDNPEAQEHAAQMAHSYTVQVILICLVVMFGCLFLFMIVKYYRLRTSIGDYRLQHGNGGGPSRQTYDNPAFDGFGVQDSYRSR